MLNNVRTQYDIRYVVYFKQKICFQNLLWLQIPCHIIIYSIIMRSCWRQIWKIKPSGPLFLVIQHYLKTFSQFYCLLPTILAFSLRKLFLAMSSVRNSPGNSLENNCCLTFGYNYHKIYYAIMFQYKMYRMLYGLVCEKCTKYFRRKLLVQGLN